MFARTLAIATATFSLVAGAAIANPAQTADAPTTKVHYRDLDLTKADGEAALRLRVARAAKTVCWREDGPTLREHARFDACRDVAIASASPKLNAVIASARSSDHRFAMNSGAIAMLGR